jgi:uncharacterized protein
MPAQDERRLNARLSSVDQQRSGPPPKSRPPTPKRGWLLWRGFGADQVESPGSLRRSREIALPQSLGAGVLPRYHHNIRTFCIPAVVLGLAWYSALPRTDGATAHPRVAIVFEHAGPSLDDLKPIYAMHQPFGLGIFLYQRYSAQIMRDAAAHGLTPILHLPLESIRPADVGPVKGIVWTRMSDAGIARTINDDLATVPGVVGVSSHAGSRATANRRVMTVVLSVIRAHGLWFQENRTTPDSVALEVARAEGLRRVLVTTYLDDPPTGIDAKVVALLKTAVSRGWAIAGAHITTGAPEIVARHLEEFRDAGVVFVPITSFLTGSH